ncbi:hypothetical protein FRC20_002773 [Serendipita sp. 405]|nr:hypothetical protein FRC20_002773 [Serendipita sp. 405]
MTSRRGNKQTNRKFAALRSTFDQRPSQSTDEGAGLCATSRFWHIPELVYLVIDNYHLIFGPRSNADLASLARVNKFIGHLALKQLWKEVDTFDYLTRLVPEDLLEITVSRNEGRKSKRIESLVATNLERYLMYSELAERVFLSTTDTALQKNTLPKLLALIERSGQGERHFRRLKHLAIASSLQTAPEAILAFFGRNRSIESVGIDLYWWADRPILATFFHKLLPQYLPRVKAICIRNNMTWASQHLLLTIVPALRELHHIEALGIKLTIQAARELLREGVVLLSSCKSLELILVSQEESNDLELLESIAHLSAPNFVATLGPPIPGRDTDGKEGIISGLSPLGREGDNCSSSSPADVLEHSISKPQIQSLSFETTSLEHFCEAFRICREMEYPLKSLKIFPESPAGASLLALTLIDVVQSYSSLEELTYMDPFDKAIFFDLSVMWDRVNQVLLSERLECLEELLLGLRHKFPLVESLVLGPTSRYGDMFIGDSRLVTLYSALNFASTCPKLQHFGIRVDARKVSAPPASDAGNGDTILASSLQSLDLGASYFDDVGYVSSLLRSATPSLKFLESSMILLEEVGISLEEENIVIDICKDLASCDSEGCQTSVGTAGRSSGVLKLQVF